MLLLDQHNGAANESRLLGTGSERHSRPGSRRAADVCVDCLIEGDEMSTAHTAMPSNWDVSRSTKIARFMCSTGADRSTAIAYLEAEEWIAYEAEYSYLADIRAALAKATGAT
jgi:hypothetical protein